MKKFDPFAIIPEEICDEILSYLNVQDIKEASLVAKHWYNLIGKSKSCMEKICLKPKNSHENEEFFKSIVDSTRIYQHLELVDRYNEVKRNTKYLRLMRDVVTKLAPTLASLKISNDLIIKVDLPRLKELVFDSCDYKGLIVANGLLTKTKRLEILKVHCWSIDEKSMKYIRIFLMENETLKVLKVEDNRLFHGLNSSNIKFRLDEFHTQHRNPIPFDFFKVHSDSLKVTNSILTRDITQFFMTNFSQLHTLTMKAFWHRDEPFDIPVNRTIRKLRLDVSSFFIQNGFFSVVIVKLIQKVQNLQEVQMQYINSQIFRALINCRSLKTVKYHECALTKQDYDEMQIHENIEFLMVPSFDHIF